MIKFILQILALLLFMCALGCNKAGGNNARGSASAAAPKLEDIKPGEAGRNDIDLGQVTGSALPTSAEEKLIRDELIAAFVADGYSFDSGTDSVKGGKLPADGVKIGSIVPLVFASAVELGGANDQTVRSKAITDFKGRFLSLVEAQAATPGGAEGVTKGFEQAGEQAAGVDPEMAMGRESLRFCDDPVGEWKSTKEVLDADAEVRVEHNDQYFKLLQVFYEGNCRYQEFRDGQIVSDGTYPWTYDKATGKLSLRAADGSVSDVLLFMDRPSEAKLIYVKGGQDYQYTVYEKVGSGNKPRTEADLKKEAAEFEAARKRLTGADGGSSASGDNDGKGKDGAKGEGKEKGK